MPQVTSGARVKARDEGKVANETEEPEPRDASKAGTHPGGDREPGALLAVWRHRVENLSQSRWQVPLCCLLEEHAQAEKKGKTVH